MSLLGWLRERRRVATLASISALRGAVFSLWGVVWQPFVLSLGVPMSSLGALESVLDLTRISVQPLVGKASDAHGRRRFIIARDILTLVSAVLYVFADSWRLVFLGIVLTGLSSAVYPIWNTLIAESREGTELGYVYSVIGTFHMGVGLIATLAAGFIATTYGFKTVFSIATVFALLSLVLVVLRLPETMVRKGDPTVGVRQLAGSALEFLRPPRHLWGYYAAMSVDLFAFSLGYRLLNGMLTKGYGYTPAMLGVMSAVMTGTMALTQIPLGRIVDRIGYARFLFISQLLSCVVLGLTIYSKEYPVIIAAQRVMGVSASFWGPAEQAWIALNVDQESRAQAIGSYSTFRGLVAFPAPLIGGILFDRYGFDAPVGVNLALAFIDAILIIALIKDRVRPVRNTASPGAR